MATDTLKIATQKQVITYTGKDMGYLDARKLVMEKEDCLHMCCMMTIW